MMERMGVVINHRDCAFIISLVDPDKSSLSNFGAFDYDLHNDHNSLLIIIDHQLCENWETSQNVAYVGLVPMICLI